jgi:hypothetical protein
MHSSSSSSSSTRMLTGTSGNAQQQQQQEAMKSYDDVHMMSMYVSHVWVAQLKSQHQHHHAAFCALI